MIINSQIRQIGFSLFVVALIMGCSPAENKENKESKESKEPQAKMTASAASEGMPQGKINDQRINNAASEPGSWLAHGLDYKEQ